MQRNDASTHAEVDIYYNEHRKLVPIVESSSKMA